VFPNHGNWDKRALSALDIDADHWSTYDAVGYAGAASVLLDTIHSVEHCESGDDLLVISYGPGGSDVLLFEIGPATADDGDRTVQNYLDSKEYVPYAKHREYRSKARGGDR
jgi:3-hydroxy-3-methylglutaryl CoA synthase